MYKNRQMYVESDFLKLILYFFKNIALAKKKNTLIQYIAFYTIFYSQKN